MAIIYDNNTPIFNGLSGLYTNVILSGGNVGVGTSTPNALLAVGNAATRGTVTVNGSTAAAPYFQLLDNQGSGRAFALYSGRVASTFTLEDTTGSNAVRLAIDSGGRVGFGGQTAPGYTVDVTGSINFTGSLYQNGVIYGGGGGGGGAAGGLYVPLSGTNGGAMYGPLSSTNTAFFSSIGIGTPTPNVKLHVYEDTDDWAVRIQNVSTGSGAAKGVAIQAGDSALTTPMIMQLRDKNANAKVTFLSQGNVGIGTAAPNAALSLGTALQDNKLYLYDGTSDKYGFGVRSSQLMIYSGTAGVSTGGITYGTFDGTTFVENVRMLNGGGVYFENGNTSAAFTKNQILLSYVNTTQYTHAIKSRHNGGAQVGNSLDFYLWQQGVDAVGTVGTLQVMTLDGNGYVGFGVTAPSYKIHVSGTGYATSDFRAPIFYDSNDTTYYVDPNSNSRIRGLGATGSEATSDPYGLVAVTRGASLNYSYFGMTRAGVLGMGMGIDTSNYIWFGGTGPGHDGVRTSTYYYFDTSGNTWAPTSSRAPIFYDSNDTTYYIDPASTTFIKYLKINTDGTSSATRALTVKTVGQNESNYGAYPGAWTSALQIQNNDNSKMLWMSPLDSSNYAQIRVNGAASGLNFIVGGTYNADGSYAMQIHTDNYVYAYASFRAPIFYDSDNTGYYLNPASTSNINAIQIAGQINQTGPGRTTTVTTAQYDAKFGSSDLYIYIKSITGGNFPVAMQLYRDSDGATSWPIVIQPAGGNTSVGTYADLGHKFGVSGTGFASNDFRAPVFYDSNNTGYYTDPASTSRMSTIDFGTGGYYIGAGSWGMRNTTPYGYIEFGPANFSHAHIYTDRSNFYFNAQIQVNGGSQINTGDIRAYIFYDQNDTTYYTDPNSNTYLYGTFQVNGAHGNSQIGVRLLAGNNGSGQGEVNLRMWCSEPGVTWNDAGFGYNVTNNGGTPNGFGRINTSHGQAYMRFTQAGDLYFYNTNTSGTRVTNMEMYSNNTVYINNYATGGNSLRAPIFYDSNNTGYYTDPNGTSNVNEMYASSYRGNANVGGTGNAIWCPNGIYSGSTQWLYGAMYRNGAGTYGGGPAYYTIFYDENDSGYYIDPNSESNWQGLTQRGKAQIGETGKSNWKRPNITGDTNYWTGAMGWGATTPNDMMTWGSGFTDSWGAGGFPGDTSHYVGIQTYHYVNGSNSGYGWQLQGGVTDSLWWRHSWPNNGGWFKVAMYGNNASTGDFYATILYDSNNTGYYCDPASTSNMNVITAQGRVNVAEYLYSTNGCGRIYLPGNLHIDAFCGHSIYLNYYSNAWIRHFYHNEHNGYDIYGVNRIDTSILYDRDNTGYYINPNGTSYVNSFITNDWFRVDGGGGLVFSSYGYGIYSAHSGGSTYGSVSTFGTGRNGWSGYSIGRWSWMSTYGDFIGLHDQNRTWMYYWDGGNHRWNYGSAIFQGMPVQANLFYDYENTGYYCDPNNQSRLNNMIIDYIYLAGNTGCYITEGWGTRLGSPGGQHPTKVQNSLVVGGLNWDGTDFGGGNIFATGSINQYWSDGRLKKNIEVISDALDKVMRLRGVTFEPDIEKAKELGANPCQIDQGREAGLIAQEVQAVLPEVVRIAPFDMNDGRNGIFESKSGDNYLTVQYERVVGLLVEAIKELNHKVDDLKEEVKTLKGG